MNIPKKPKNHKRHFFKIIIIPILAIMLSLVVLITFRCGSVHSPKKSPDKTSPTVIKSTKSTATTTNTKTNSRDIFNKSLYSTSDSSSLWVIVNKQHQLTNPQYTPKDLTSVDGGMVSAKVSADLKQLTTDAKAQNITIAIGSGYRSYTTQTSLYNSYVATYGQASADTFSARPSYSEHQTGLAIDFTSPTNPSCNYDDCFANTAEGKWLAQNATKYGFIIRYTAGNQSITGYKNEPWHLRYIGQDLANEMKKQAKTTLEEFFNISGGTIYK